MGVKIQVGSADIVKANSKQVEAEGWETIVDACDTRGALEELVRKLNDGSICSENNWFRIVVGKMVIKI